MTRAELLEKAKRYAHGRTDLEDLLPSFLLSAETDLKSGVPVGEPLRLHDDIRTQTLYLSNGSTALPSGCAQVIRVTTDDGGRYHAPEGYTGEGYTIEGNSLKATGSSVEVSYYIDLLPLENDDDDNSISRQYPSIYLSLIAANIGIFMLDTEFAAVQRAEASRQIKAVNAEHRRRGYPVHGKINR